MKRKILRLFKSIGIVESDRDLMRLNSNDIPVENGVYGFFFDGNLKYIGSTVQSPGKGLRSRMNSYLRRRTHVEGGTTSEIRKKIRTHINQGGKVEVRVVTDCRIEIFGIMSSNDPRLFERAAINILKPEFNRN